MFLTFLAPYEKKHTIIHDFVSVICCQIDTIEIVNSIFPVESKYEFKLRKVKNDYSRDKEIVYKLPHFEDIQLTCVLEVCASKTLTSSAVAFTASCINGRLTRIFRTFVNKISQKNSFNIKATTPIFDSGCFATPSSIVISLSG